jgi:hypothetical protein
MEPSSRNWRTDRPESNLEGKEFCALSRNISGFVFAKIAQSRPSATVILDKTPNHVSCWREILDAWPEAHFIHIIRDPRSVVASLRVASRSWASQWASSNVSGNCDRWISDVRNGGRSGSLHQIIRRFSFKIWFPMGRVS